MRAWMMLGCLCGALWASGAAAQDAAKTTAAPTAAEAEARLRAAYKKEYAFLEAEKTALAQRLADAERRAAAEERATKAELEGLQRRLIALTVEADGLGEALVELERESEAASEGADALAGLVQQMVRSFEQAGVEWPPPGLALRVDGEAAEPAEDATARAARLLGDGFERIGPVIKRLGAVRRTEGAFFLADGTQVANRPLGRSRPARRCARPRSSSTRPPTRTTSPARRAPPSKWSRRAARSRG